jgi:hypothetical protein
MYHMTEEGEEKRVKLREREVVDTYHRKGNAVKHEYFTEDA